METRAAKRRRLAAQAEERTRDRITNLPDPILHHILSLLPIQTIGKTSLLSKRWLYLWRSYPCLDFSSVPPPIGSGSDSIIEGKLHNLYVKSMEFIHPVLARRQEDSNIKIFRFHGHLSGRCCSDMFRRVVKNGVEELELNLAVDNSFGLPRCLFNSDSLRVLKLNHKTPNPVHHKFCKPSCFSHYIGFQMAHAVGSACLRSIHTLMLTRVHFMGDKSLRENLFSVSVFRMLKTLHLKGCRGFADLKINIPSVEHLELHNLSLVGLDIRGERLEFIHVMKCIDKHRKGTWVKIFAPFLKKFRWDCNPITDECSMECFRNMNQGSVSFYPEALTKGKLRGAATLLQVFSSAHSLYVASPIVQLFSNIDLVGVHINPFINLVTLDLHTGLNKQDILGILCLLRSTPVLSTLNITIDNNLKMENDIWNRDLLDNSNLTEEEYWESQSHVFKSLGDHLQFVKIDVQGYKINESAVNLVKLLLRHGRVLEQMTLSSGTHPKEPTIWQQKIGLQIMQFQQASCNVKISFV